MNSFVKSVNRIDKVIYTIEKYITMLGMISLVTLVTIQVVMRYLLQMANPWTEELARYVFIWTTYVGCGMCFSRKKHVVIDLIDEVVKRTKDPKTTAFYVQKATMIACLTFIFIFLSQYVSKYYSRIVSMGKTTTAIGLPMGIPAAGVIAGCVFMAWHAFVILIQPMKKEDSKQ